MVKFLIIRFSSIGDIVLTTPVVRCLKTQVEGAVVHYLTKPQFASILSNNPNIDKVHVLQEDFTQTINELVNEQFDHIIDLHNNLRSARVKNKLGVGSFAFKKLNVEKWLMVNFKINKLPAVHIVDRYMETLKIFDVNNDNKGLDFFIDEKDQVNPSEINAELQNGYIAFVIGAKHFTKKIPGNKIIELAKKLNRPIVLLGGPDEKTEGESLARELTQANILVVNACGGYNLGQSASWVSQAWWVISSDTGLMHIAAAFQKNIISVWGNTIPEFGMYPYLAGEKSEIAEVKNLKCRPCTKIGFRMCPKKHFTCMNNIDTDKIVSIIDKN